MTKKVYAFENETISTEIIKEIVTDLHRDKLEMLTFRNCMFTDKAYKKTMEAVGACTSLALRQLGLHVGIVCDSFRVQVLAQALQKNASLVGLQWVLTLKKKCVCYFCDTTALFPIQDLRIMVHSNQPSSSIIFNSQVLGNGIKAEKDTQFSCHYVSITLWP